MKGKYYSFFLLLLAGLPLYTGFIPCVKANLLWITGFLIMGVGGALTLYYLIESYEKLKVMIEDNKLVLSTRIGKIIIPTSIIKEVKTIESIHGLLRIGGLSLPGAIDVGNYFSKELGRIKAMITRKRNLLLLRFKNNAKLLISPAKPNELASTLEKYVGRGPEAPIKVLSIDKYFMMTSIIVALLLISYGMSVYTQLPENVPTHYNKNWVPREYGPKKYYAGILVFTLIIDIVAALIGDKLSRSIPGFNMVTAPFILGLTFVLISTIILPTCIS